MDDEKITVEPMVREVKLIRSARDKISNLDLSDIEKGIILMALEEREHEARERYERTFRNANFLQEMGLNYELDFKAVMPPETNPNAYNNTYTEKTLSYLLARDDDKTHTR